jgi:putative PIG3 family NAD(P)H quinone oxidoreductase
MRAVIFDEPGDENVLRVSDVPAPPCGMAEVRIQVAGAGVNRADLLQRKGLYPPPLGAPEILGLECSGTVVEVGNTVSDFAVGDLVMALLTGGGYSEQVVAPSEVVMRVPVGLPPTEAGGVPEVFLTAFLNIFHLGGLEPGRTALVHGGSGGVGTAAIQLIRAARATVLVTAGSEERCERCRRLGASAAFNHREDDWVTGTLDATDGRGVDLILDCVGAPYLGRHLDVLAIGGRLVVIGLQGGREAALDLSVVMRKRLTIIGSTLRARPVTEKRRIISAFVHQFGRELETGAIRPIVDRILPFDRAAEAHRLLAGGDIFGKIILTPG